MKNGWKRFGMSSVVVAGCAMLLGCPVEEDPDFDPQVDTAEFAYQTFVDGGQRIYFATLDGLDARATDTDELGNEDIGPSFSPDGEYLAYSHGEDGVYDVYILDISEGTATRATEFGEEEECMAGATSWHPDGEKIAVGCLTGDEANPVIFGVYDIDSQGLTLFEPEDDDTLVLGGGFGGDGNLYGAVWEIDGVDPLLEDIEDTFRIFDLEDPQDPGEVLFTFDDARISASWLASYQSNRAVFTRVNPEDEEDVELLLVDFGSDDYVELLEDEDELRYAMAFHPEEDSILIGAGSHATSVGSLRLIDADDDSDQVVLADSDTIVLGSLSGQISPDGQQVLFSDTNSEDNVWSSGSIYRVDVDGSNLEQLDWVSDPVGSSNATFNPAAF